MRNDNVKRYSRLCQPPNRGCGGFQTEAVAASKAAISYVAQNHNQADALLVQNKLAA